MYHIESQDVDRFAKIVSQLKTKYPWDGMHANILHQVGPVEFEIQKWWADKVNLIDKRVNILSGGIGYFAVPFAHEKGAAKINLYDMDPVTSDLSWYVNQIYKPVFVHHQENIIFDGIEKSDVYINTSCEHSYDMKNIIPKGKICVISGNDLTSRGHINVFKNMKALKKSVGFDSILFQDTKQFKHEDDIGVSEYNQFFVIGVKS